MKRIVLFLAFISTINIVVAQESNDLHNSADSTFITQIDSTFTEAHLDSLLRESLYKGDYEAAKTYAKELSELDSLSYNSAYDCASYFIYTEKYESGIKFCKYIEDRFPSYHAVLRPIYGECYFYLKDYNTACNYFKEDFELCEDIGIEQNTFDTKLYAKSLYLTHQYSDAEFIYQTYFDRSLKQEGLTISDVDKSEYRSQYGYTLYDYAYNCFFLGIESKGMALLELASRCGDEYAQADLAILNECETIMMDLDFTPKIQRQYDNYLYEIDCKSQPSKTLSSVDQVKEFWRIMLLENETYNNLQTELSKDRRRKLLQRALNEISANAPNMKYALQTYYPYETGEFEQNMIEKVIGNPLQIEELRVYSESSPNAFATPFGQIYLTDGLVYRYHFNDNLLAGVIAHEMTHYLCKHSLVGLWQQYEKERKAEIAAGIAAGLYAASMTAATMYGASNGVTYDQSHYDNISDMTVGLFTSISNGSYYFQFKYSREQEIESDLMAYRFCEAMGIGGYAYIMALQLLGENDLIMKANKTDDHPTTAYRVGFLKYIYAKEHSYQD